MSKYMERQILYRSAADCHFWQEFWKANDRTPKVSSWSYWLCDVWCTQCKEKMMWEQNEKISGSTVRSLGAPWAQPGTGAAAPGCCRALVHPVRPTAPLPALMVGTAPKGHPEEAGLNGSSPLRTGHRISSQQSLCRLPAGRFSYGNSLSPFNKESSC